MTTYSKTKKRKTKNSNKSTNKVDLYQTVTDKMIALLEQGKIPWHCPWSKYGMAKNYATNHRYSGINALWMNLTEHPIPYFMSFKQIKEKGGNVKKGATSEMVFFFKSYHKNGNGERISQGEYESLIDQGAEAERIAFLKYYRVFNIADVEGIEIEIPQVELQEHEPIKRCEQLIGNYQDAPEKIFRDANKAYYNPFTDQLNMPDMAQFESAESYYSVYFHELIHSTGHKKRLAREGITELNLFGETNYSKEELIAEMGASFLRAYSGIDVPQVTQNSAAYLQGWLSKLKEDKKFIFKSAAKAQQAVDYMLGTDRAKLYS